MFKTAFIVANVAFVVKVISEKNAAATVARGPSHATRACERVPPAIAPPKRKTSVAQRPWTFFETIAA